MSPKHPSLGLEEKHNLWAVLAAVPLFAPLFRAGNRTLPLMILELAALVLLAPFWTQRKKQR